MPGIDHNELQDLLAALCAGKITLQEARRLDDLVTEHPAAREAYLDFMAVEAELHASHSFGAASALADSAHPNVSAPHCRFSFLPQSLRRGYWFALAASVLGVAVVSSLFTVAVLQSNRSAGPVAAASDRQSPLAVGAITATRNCRWSAHNGGFGDLVSRGQKLSLQQGVAEISFNSGATVLLEGPALLDIDDSGGVTLRSGRLSVDSPADLEALPIRAGRIKIANRGGSYGLIAEASGGGELHVFDGTVVAVLLGAAGNHLQSCEFTGGHGGRLDDTSTQFQPIAAHGDLFVRSLSPGIGPKDGLYAIEAFDYAGGPLGEQNGGFGWAGPWTDIETADGPSGGSTNVVSERSLSWPGMPPVGNHAAQLGQANRIRRVLSTSVKGVFDTAGYVENRDAHRLIGREGKTLFLAFLQRTSRVDDVFYGVELNRGDGNGNRVLCIGNGADESGYAATSNFNNYIHDRALLLGKEDTHTNLIVVRLDFGDGDQDTATVYRNPESLAEERACTPIAVMQGNFAFDRISLGNFNGTKTHEVDDLRLGGAFRVVTGQRSFMQGQLAFGAPQGPGLLPTQHGTFALARFDNSRELFASPGYTNR
jgi:hypothetical protein